MTVTSSTTSLSIRDILIVSLPACEIHASRSERILGIELNCAHVQILFYVTNFMHPFRLQLNLVKLLLCASCFLDHCSLSGSHISIPGYQQHGHSDARLIQCSRLVSDPVPRYLDWCCDVTSTSKHDELNEKTYL